MSRTVKEYRFQMLPPYFQQQMEQLLASEGYKPYMNKGVRVYKYGSGWLTAPKFFAVTILPNVIRVEGWIKFPIFPGLYCGESQLSGFYGTIPKASARMMLDTLERFLLSHGAVPALPNYPPQQQYGQPSQGYQQPQQYGQPPQGYQQPQQCAQPPQGNPQPAFRVCAKCGARVAVGSAFCSACGNRLQ